MKFVWNKKTTTTMDQKVTQIINDHNAELTKLTGESEDALDSFRQTVTQLNDINNKIDASVMLMDQQISELSSIKETMLEKKTRNAKVKSKIQEFLA